MYSFIFINIATLPLQRPATQTMLYEPYISSGRFYDLFYGILFWYIEYKESQADSLTSKQIVYY